MFPRKKWFLVFLPNLVLFMSQGYPKNDPQRFDEGYLARDEQIWIQYKNPEASHFHGVWANRFEQRKIIGIRRGSSFWFLSGNKEWRAQLNERKHRCEPVLEIQSEIHQEKKILKANYCNKTAPRNQFF